MKELNYLDITKTGQGHIKVPSANGIHPDMGVGTAQQIQTNIHESDSTPYVFRPTPFNSTRESGDIVGASVAWNQLVKARDSSSGSPSLAYTKINDYQLLLSGSRDAVTLRLSEASNIQFVTGHKYLAYHNDPTFPATQFVLSNSAGEATNTTGKVGVIINAEATTTGYYGVYIPNGVTFNNTISVNLIDLTLALGSTIADYIYTLETGTAGAGIAKLREWGFFTKPYYAYNAGGIESVNVSKHKMVGLNQWDEEWEVGDINTTTGANTPSSTTIRAKNYTPVFPSTVYCLTCKSQTNLSGYAFYYDGDKNFVSSYQLYASGADHMTITTPDNARYIRFRMSSGYGTTYKNDICINISNPAINGTYEPYTVYEYPLPTGDLRGGLKLDANNNLYAYGDIRHPDGTVTRKYGTITLDGTLSYFGSATNGFYVPLNGLAKLFDYRDVILANGLSVTTNNTSVMSATFQITGYKDTNNAYPSKNWLYIYLDSSYTTTTAYKDYFTAHPTTVVYLLDTPTTETADPYNEVQVCSPYGTEEFVDAGVAAGTRDVAIPVGHNTSYAKNIVGAIEGIPLSPSANGTYTLKVTVASGVPTYSWVSE